MRTLIALAALATLPAQATIQWQDNSLTYLYGQDFAVTPDTQQTLTFEHASGWDQGDLFIFVDGFRFNGVDGDNTGWYGEIAPRLSLGKLTGNDFSAGPVKDVLFAATYEFGEGAVETWLWGAGVDLALPGFDFFQLNVYRRNPQGERDGNTWQFTPVWKMSFPLGDSKLVFDGFADWVVDNDGGYHANLHFNPQLKYDLGMIQGLGPDRLFVGIEYDYWSNKFGIKDSHGFDTDQSVVNLLVKYHF